MPRCTRCNPTCQRCHRKPGFIPPQECPVCGRYNPADWQFCKRCNAPVPKPDLGTARSHLSTETSVNCFKCDPLTAPLCKGCVKAGRIKICPECDGYVLGTRKDCKHCGYKF